MVKVKEIIKNIAGYLVRDKFKVVYYLNIRNLRELLSLPNMVEIVNILNVIDNAIRNETSFKKIVKHGIETPFMEFAKDVIIISEFGILMDLGNKAHLIKSSVVEDIFEGKNIVVKSNGKLGIFDVKYDGGKRVEFHIIGGLDNENINYLYNELKINDYENITPELVRDIIVRKNSNIKIPKHKITDNGLEIYWDNEA